MLHVVEYGFASKIVSHGRRDELFGGGEEIRNLDYGCTINSTVDTKSYLLPEGLLSRYSMFHAQERQWRRRE